MAKNESKRNAKRVRWNGDTGLWAARVGTRTFQGDCGRLAFPSLCRQPLDRDQGRWFSSLVVGYVYEGRRLEGGLPLGALGTGYMTLEGNGKLGFCSIFNDLVPPSKLFTDWLVVESGAHSIPLSIADIQYWGHYPVADLSARFDESPVEIGIRAFTPFIVGDAAASNTPVALFNLELRNVSDVSFPVTLHLNFPLDVPESQKVKGGELAVRGEGVVEVDSAQGHYCVSLEISAHASRHVRFAVGWYAPIWRDSGSEPRINRYSQRFKSAADVASFGLSNHDRLLRRVLAWQSEIYRANIRTGCVIL